MVKNKKAGHPQKRFLMAAKQPDKIPEMPWNLNNMQSSFKHPKQLLVRGAGACYSYKYGSFFVYDTQLQPSQKQLGAAGKMTYAVIHNADKLNLKENAQSIPQNNNRDRKDI